ncbi:ATP-binding protein [Aquimarina algiphila]|uniref:ATP-binding protein n=1 Tax=Aquimarina algiphila TaxID=2047982 RepID=UPI00232EE139|nr:ATP-binding protein [Aquimarina algiphila]
MLLSIFAATCIALLYAIQYGEQLNRKKEALNDAKELEKIIHYFSNSLYGKNTVDEILWDITKNCVGHLGFVDCVIYILDERSQVLKQKAAYGNKNIRAHEIYNPIDIPVGKGIVGYVAKEGKPLLVEDTTKDTRYIIDDNSRLSEIAVPIIIKDKLIGVIDSEHPDKKFYTKKHLNALKVISVLCANKIAGTLAEEEREKALRIKLFADQLKEIDTLRTKLFANISHELRTPLTLMKGTIEDQMEQSPAEGWKLMESQTNKLLRLINQLLDLTKLESGKFQLKLESKCIYNYIRAQVGIYTSFATKGSIEIISHIPEGKLYVEFDEDAMDNILSNLMSNAIKYSSKGDKIEFIVNYKDNVLEIQVKDQGIGINEESLPKIFDRFYQASNTVGIGTGLGLTLAKELVELYGGQIYAESTIDKGSTFFVKLPFKRIAEDELKPAVVYVSEKKQKRHNSNETKNDVKDKYILVVEDNLALGEMIVNKLKQSYKVAHVLDGKLGVEEAKKNLPDLIISDVMMEGLNGIELCSQLKSYDLTSHIPIILLTAKTDTETKILGLNTGADDYLLKPFNTKELKARIENLLQQRKLLKSQYKKIIDLSPSDITITNNEEIFVKKVITIIEQNLDNNNFGATELCKSLGMSRMQLHRKITSLTEYSTSSFIRYIRLQRAKDFLKIGETVSQTAYKVGFNSLSYFTTAFKKQFGSLPSDFN